MNVFHPFRGKLTRRYLLVLVALSLFPAVAIFAIPIIFQLKTSSGAYVSSYIELVLLIGVCFFLIVAFAGWLTFLWLVQPLQELMRGARTLTHGQYTYRIPLKNGNDEISELAAAFNAMAQSIHDNQMACLTEQQTLQNMLSRREAEFDVIAQVAALVNDPPDLPSNLYTALSLAGRVLETDFLAVFLCNENGEFFFTSAYSRDANSERFRQHCREMIDLPLLNMAVKKRDWVRTLDINQSKVPLTEHQLEAYERLGVNRVGVKPIIAQERVLGAMLLMRHRYHYIPITEITFAETFTNHLALLIINHQLKTQARDLVIMEERRRLASELHDSVTQSLFSLGMATQSLVNYLGDVSGPPRSAIELIEAQTHNIQTELRNLINELRPLNLRAEEGLDYALKLHLNSLRQSLRAETNLRVDGDTRGLPLPVQQTLNRVAQEALSNIARHSQASRVEVILTIAANEACLEINDNGVGFARGGAQAQMFRSYGLTSMRDRAEFIGGALELKTAPGEGVQIIVRVPLEEKAEAGDG